MLTASLSTSTVTAGNDTGSSSSSSSSDGGGASYEAEAPHHSWQGSVLTLGRLGCVVGTMGVLSGMQGKWHSFVLL